MKTFLLTAIAALALSVSANAQDCTSGTCSAPVRSVARSVVTAPVQVTRSVATHAVNATKKVISRPLRTTVRSSPLRRLLRCR